jgi:hypothetical protein
VDGFFSNNVRDTLAIISLILSLIQIGLALWPDIFKRLSALSKPLSKEPRHPPSEGKEPAVVPSRLLLHDSIIMFVIAEALAIIIQTWSSYYTGKYAGSWDRSLYLLVFLSTMFQVGAFVLLLFGIEFSASRRKYLLGKGSFIALAIILIGLYVPGNIEPDYLDRIYYSVMLNLSIIWLSSFLFIILSTVINILEFIKRLIRSSGKLERRS